MTALARLLRAFSRFWWDFLIGDTPETILATLLIVAAAIALRHHHWTEVSVLPVLTGLTLILSAISRRRRTR